MTTTLLDPTPKTSPTPKPRSPRPRRTSRPTIGRRTSQRLTRETLLDRAPHLAPVPRALLTAHLDLGMTYADLATLHRTSPRKIRRRIDRLRDLLSDPCFLIAAQFSPHLPPELASLARDHWLEGKTLRALATARHKTLHRIRQDLSVARSLLVLAMSAQQSIPPELARAAIDGQPQPQTPPQSVTRP